MKSLKSLVIFLGYSASLGCIHAASICFSNHQNLISQCQAPLCLDGDLKSSEEVEATQHRVRSHQPFCLEGKGMKYCAHTTSNFRNGHSLGVIAHPTAADAISSAFSASRSAGHMSEEGLEVRSLPRKGKGLITARSVAKGQAILLDSPKIIASAQFPSHVTHAQGRSLFETVLDQLLPSDRTLVMSLDISLGGTDIENVMKTNAFACQLNDGDVGDGYMCLFPSVARINHACQPNAHARFVPRTLLMEIKAIRDIAAGEEISISYGQIHLQRAERQQLYRGGWNFTCTCSLCTASPYEIRKSDQRRARFMQLRRGLESLTASTYNAQQIVAWEKEVIDISEKEGLEILLAGDYERLAYIYAGHGMKAAAKDWAAKAKESLIDWKVADGGPNNDIVRVDELLRELDR